MHLQHLSTKTLSTSISIDNSAVQSVREKTAFIDVVTLRWGQFRGHVVEIVNGLNLEYSF